MRVDAGEREENGFGKQIAWISRRKKLFGEIIPSEIPQVLQICNISRDIIIDSEELGRCYVPESYLTANERELLTVHRTPNDLPNQKLRSYAIKLLDLADSLTNEAIHAVNLLPRECQRAVLGALQIYRGIGNTIRQNDVYPRRTVATKWTKLKTILSCVYLTNGEVLCDGYDKQTKNNKHI